MMHYLKSKEDVVQCVEELLAPLEQGSVLTMIITVGASEGCFVRSVTDASSEDIVTLLGKFYLERLQNT